MKEDIKLSAVVTGLQDYIDQVGNAEIIRALAGSAPSIQYFATQAGVNQPTDIHLLEVEGAFGDGKNCEPNDNTNLTFTDRQLDPAIVKQETIICKADLYGKWLAYKDKITASNHEISFGQVMIEAFQENVKENLEDAIWNGITIGSKTYDGFANIIAAEGTEVKAGAKATVYNMVVAAIKAAPAKSRRKSEIFISEELMLKLKEELLKNDFRLFDLNFTNGAIADEHTIKLPVYGNLVHEVSALNGDENVYLMVPEHAVYGYSVNGAENDIEVAYDNFTGKTVIRATLAVATQIAYPSETVIVKAED